MNHFEALYGRKYNTPINWVNPTDIIIIRPELLKDMKDQMININQNLKLAQDK